MFHGDLRFHRDRRPFALQSPRDSISIVDIDVSRCVTADSGHAGNAWDRPLSRVYYQDFKDGILVTTCQPRRG